WPSGEGVVRVTCRQQGEDTEVKMEEDAKKGPALLVPRVLRDLALDQRNREALARLAILVERAGADVP
ncbi:MAG: SRPBCC family protein, partial [Terrabacter sp.]